MSDAALLKDRRFATRFLGRPGTWIWLGSTLVPGAATWAWAHFALRGFARDERTWFLWSGNVVLALFVLTLGFVFRKWSVKLRLLRDLGRAPAAMADACWTEIQVINRKIQSGAYGKDEEILAAADEALRRFHVERIQRAEIRTAQAGGRTLKFVTLRKREPLGRLEPWLEMHMGVGVAACVGVWFHADGVLRHPIGWTLLVASAVVLATGLALAVLYRVLPEKLAAVQTEIPFEEAGVARENYETCLAAIVGSMPPEMQAEIGGMLRRSSSFEDLRARSEAVLLAAATKFPDQAELVRDVIVMAGTRDQLLWSTAAARRIDAQLKLWRWVHVPVSVFLFFVIAFHVLVVLYR